MEKDAVLVGMYSKTFKTPDPRDDIVIKCSGAIRVFGGFKGFDVHGVRGVVIYDHVLLTEPLLQELKGNVVSVTEISFKTASALAPKNIFKYTNLLTEDRSGLL